MPDELHSLIKDAESLFLHKEWDAALEKYQKVMELDPQNEEACYKLAEIYAIRGLIISVVNQYYQLMDIFEAKGELDMALDVAGTIARLSPENVNARMKAILIYQKKGNLQELIKQSIHLGRLLIGIGQGDQAIMLLQKAYEHVPDNLEIGSELGEVYISHGHIQEGVAQFRKIANDYLGKKQLERAADVFRRIKVFQSEDQEILYILGSIYLSLNRLNDAEAEFRAILRYNLNNLDALSALGNVCQMKGAYKDAILAFNKILSLNSHDVVAKEKLGELYQAQGAIADSVKHYLSAAQYRQMGGNTDRAIKLYQRVLVLDPTNPTACRELTNLGAPLVSEKPDELIFEASPIVKLKEKMAVHAAEVAEDKKKAEEIAAMASVVEEAPAPEPVVPAEEAPVEAEAPVAEVTIEAVVEEVPVEEAEPPEEVQAESVPEVTLVEKFKRPGLVAKKGIIKPARGELGQYGKPVLGKPRLEKERVIEEETVPARTGLIKGKPLLETVSKPQLMRKRETPEVPAEITSEPEKGEEIAPPVPEIQAEAAAPLFEAAPVAEDVPAIEEAESFIKAEAPPEEAAVSAPSAVGESPFSVRISAFGKEFYLSAATSRQEVFERINEEARAAEIETFNIMIDGAAISSLASFPATLEGLHEIEVSRHVAGRAEEITVTEPEPVSLAAEEALAVEEALIEEAVTAAEAVPVEEEILAEEILAEEPPVIEEKVPALEAAPFEEEITAPALEAEVPSAEAVEEAVPVAEAEELAPALSAAAEEVPAVEEALIEEAVTAAEAVPVEEEILAEEILAEEPPVIEEKPPLVILGQPVTPWQPPEEAKIEAEADKLSQYLESGRINLAIASYKKLIEQSREDSGLRLKLTEIYMDYGLLPEAISEYRSLINDFPEDLELYRKLINAYLWTEAVDESVEIILKFARVLLAGNEIDEAEEVLRKGISLNHQDPALREALAEIYLQKNNNREALFHSNALAEIFIARENSQSAIEVYKKILGLTGDISIQEKLGILYSNLGRIPEAVREFKNLAERYEENKDFSRAASCYERIISLAPDNIEAHRRWINISQKIGDSDRTAKKQFALASLYVASSRLNDAQIILEEVLSVNPEHHDARRLLVEVYTGRKYSEKAQKEAQILSEHYYKTKNYSDAIQMYKKLIEGDPKNIQLKENLSQFYILNDQKEEALQEILSLAEALTAREQWDEVIKTYKKAIAISSKNADVYFRLGKVYMEHKINVKEALQAFQQVYELDPAHREAMRLMVLGYLRENKPIEAMKMVEKFVSLDPENNASLKDEILAEYQKKADEQPEDMQIRFSLGVIYKELGRVENAIEQFQKTKNYTPLLLASYNMLGLCFSQKKGAMFELAVRQFKKGIETKGFKDEEYLELHYNLAQLYESRGMIQEAKEYYENAYAIEVNYRDVKEKIEQLTQELSSSKITRLPKRE